MSCAYEFWGLCFAPMSGPPSIFAFKDFIQALALLALIYTLTDVRYRFRIAVAPIPLYQGAFWVIGIVGLGTLLNDLWISEQWLVPVGPLSTGIWQAFLALLFLVLVIAWMYYAFLRRPIFSRRNFKKYGDVLFRIVLKGSDDELPIIAHEVAGSAEALVAFASDLPKVKATLKKDNKPVPFAEGYAHDLLLLIANRKFCRHLVASSPATAVVFLDEVSEKKAYDVPIGLFTRNVATEALINTDSILYHEDEGYESGLLGYIKPFSKALFGNYDLISRLDHDTPLDLHYEVFGSLTPQQFAAYCRCALLTLKDFHEKKHWNHHGVVSRLFGHMASAAGQGISEYEKSRDTELNDGWRRLREAVQFLKESVTLIEEHNPRPPQRLRLRGDHSERFRQRDLYDGIAEAMFKILHSAAYVKEPPDRAWTIHHNSTFGEFFDLATKSKPWKVVHFKLRRLLYEEIVQIETRPNYKNARVLGICLNVLGLGPPTRGEYGREYRALQKVVRAFVRRTYMRLRQVNVEIADACLIGSITYEDAPYPRLVKTYAKGLEPEPSREYLKLDPAPEMEAKA